MKRKLLLILTAALCVSALAGCGKSKEQQAVESAVDRGQEAVKQMEKTADEGRKLQEENDAKFENEQIPIKDIEFETEKGKYKLKSYVILKENQYSENESFILTYDYTNTSGENAASYNHIQMGAYQSGVSLASIASKYGKDESSSIKDGATIEVVSAYILRDDKTPVEIEFKEGYDSEPVTFTIDI